MATIWGTYRYWKVLEVGRSHALLQESDCSGNILGGLVRVRHDEIH